MSNKKHQIPAIRFNGFTDAWEQHKLGDFSDVTKLAGFEFTKYVEYSDSGKIIALRGLNVKNGNLVLDDVKYIDESDFSKLNRSKLFKNDLLLTYVGTVGQLAIIPEDDRYYLAPNVARIRIDNQNDPMFISQQMTNESFYNRIIIPLIATSSQPALSMENVRKFELQLPNIEEQKKIGAFFKSLDDTIALHQRQLNDYKKLKKSMMQKIFNQEICFKDPDDNDYPRWDEKQLGELADIEKGTQINRDSLSQIESKELYPVYNGGITPSGFHSDYNREPGSVIVSEGGNSCGYVNYVSERFWSGGHSYTIKKKNEKINTKYLFQLLKFNETKIMALRVGTGLPNIQKPSLSKYGLLVSSDESEQQKIANFLSIFDVRIEKSSQKVELLKEQKKRLMYQMFV